VELLRLHVFGFGLLQDEDVRFPRRSAEERKANSTERQPIPAPPPSPEPTRSGLRR
jgi:hypothetical protein